MKYLPALFCIFIFSSCSQYSETGKSMAAADSLVIRFYQPGTEEIARTVSTTEKNAIGKLAGFVDGKKTQLFKCGYDGQLLFYSGGVSVQDVSFNYSGAGCKHFIFSEEDKPVATEMSHEAADFLESLAKGRNRY